MAELLIRSTIADRRVPLLDRYQHDFPASGFDGIAANNLIGRPVRAFDQDVRLHQANDLRGRVFLKNHHGVDALECGQHLGTLETPA